MANKEISIPFNELGNSQTITQKVTRKFKEQGLDIHKNDCLDMVDDHSTQRRIYKLKNTKFFGPWKHRG